MILFRVGAGVVVVVEIVVGAAFTQNRVSDIVRRPYVLSSKTLHSTRKSYFVVIYQSKRSVWKILFNRKDQR